jgi:hypothetical protein
MQCQPVTEVPDGRAPFPELLEVAQRIGRCLSSEFEMTLLWACETAEQPWGCPPNPQRGRGRVPHTPSATVLS